jgi:hypothetical protein
MKKVFLLLLFAMAVFASGAWAGDYCNYGTCVGRNDYDCDSGGCYPKETDGNGNVKACAGSNTEVDCCPAGTTPLNDAGLCGVEALFCAWPTGCYQITADKRADCESSSNVWKDVKTACRGDNKDCSCGTFVSGLTPGEHYDWCDWGECIPEAGNEYGCSDGGCFKITDDEKRADCASGKTIVSEESQCDNNSYSIGRKKELGISSIVSVPKAQGLTVLSSGKVLHILSVRDAQVSLFDLSGSLVLSGNVKAGNSEFSLKTLKQGIYYAKVQSGSQTQTVKVMLK